MRKIVLPLAWVASVVLLSLGLSGSEPTNTGVRTAKPNIVFILIDDLRWDELGLAGHPYIKTPNIDRLGKEGAMFRNAFITTPLCSPSRSCWRAPSAICGCRSRRCRRSISRPSR